jgi:hypothetical protein
MNEIRDKFLTEAMGYKWHDCQSNPDGFWCDDCADEHEVSADFSTWEGFGQLWEWCNGNNGFMMGTFIRIYTDHDPDNMLLPTHLINPNRFANAVYKYLKETNE